MKVDHNSDKPLHIQAEEILRRLTESEEHKNGELFPNEVELSEQLRISRNTLRQAISKFVFEGFLVRKKGYGAKVAEKGIVGGVRNWLSLSQEMKVLSIEIRNFELYISLKRPTEEIDTFFNLGSNSDTRCVVMERVRREKEYPSVCFISYLNPNILLTGEEDCTRPLYEMLETQYNIVVRTGREEISARLTGEPIAEKLEIKSSDPISTRERLVCDVNGVLIEYNVGYYRADGFTYAIEVER